MPSSNSLRLVAALALASHAPGLKPASKKAENEYNITDLDSMINDPIFTQALNHIKSTIQSKECPLSDPRVQLAMRQAYSAMQTPEMKKAIANRQPRRPRWGGVSSSMALA